MKKSDYHDKAVVVVTPGMSANTLGVIRCFGRRGIPVLYIDSKRVYTTSYSKYICQRFKCTSPRQSETEFVTGLMSFGKQLDHKPVIIPTNDEYVLSLSKYKRELEQFFHVPVAEFNTVQTLVNKCSFYKLLAKMNIPHPRTYFPGTISELWSMGKEVNYPYIIKPAYSFIFQEEFSQKCFLTNSVRELELAVKRLEDKNIEVMIQEIIPGKGTYEFYTYFNKKSEMLGVCGWDRIRQYPPDFGSGSFCESRWRPSATGPALRLLRTMGYHGFAAPDQKKDPRDGNYKLLEINARTTLQNRLAAACGVDIEYIAYLDVTGYGITDRVTSSKNMFWIDDFLDQASCLLSFKRKQVGLREIVKSFQARKLHSVAAWDDPVPVLALVIGLFESALKLLHSKLVKFLQKQNN